MGGTYFALSIGKVGDVQVPDLVNLTLEEAEAKAKELKLKIEVKEEKYHLEIEEGRIIEQNPEYRENFKIKQKSTIKVVVSKGQEIIKMPKAVGLKRDEAMKLLKEAGLEVEIKEENSDSVEKDYVIKQETEDGKEIKEDEEIPAGTKIILYVSMGIEQVEVPDLNGKTESEAKSAISKANLKWKSTDKTSDSSKPNGVVVNQSISSGSMVDKNTEITITVNEFDEIKTGTISVNLKNIFNYPRYNEDGTTKPAENVTITVLINGEEKTTKNTTEDKESYPIEVSTSGSKNVTIKMRTASGRLETREIQYNAGENRSI